MSNIDHLISLISQLIAVCSLPNSATIDLITVLQTGALFQWGLSVLQIKIFKSIVALTLIQMLPCGSPPPCDPDKQKRMDAYLEKMIVG